MSKLGLGRVGKLVLVAGAFLGATSASVLADTPPAMPAITFPVDTASIVTAIVAAGFTILLLWIGPTTAFKLVKGLARKLQSAFR